MIFEGGGTLKIISVLEGGCLEVLPNYYKKKILKNVKGEFYFQVLLNFFVFLINLKCKMVSIFIQSTRFNFTGPFFGVLGVL